MKNVAIATITRATTPGEADLLFTALQALARHGLPVAAGDAGSEESFLERLRTIPGVTPVPPRTRGRGLVAQVQAALEAARASRSEYILYTEPDKRWFFEHRLANFLAQEQRYPRAGILIPARDPASFATFPQGQQLSESLLNHLCSRVFEQEGDYLYGPLLIRADLVAHLRKIPANLRWGWRTYLLAVAVRLGLGIPRWTASLTCPEEQRGEDDPPARIYRIEQMAQGAAGLAAGLKVSPQARE